MESHAKYILVGGFVLVSTVLIVVAMLWLAEAGGGRSVKYYTAYFRQHSLDGLQKDSNVTMKGIKVGSVDSYQISPQNIEIVKVTLRLDKNVPVKVDTEATLKRNLLTGLATIDLVGSTQDSPLLEKIAPGEQYPVVPEGKSQLEMIADSIPGLLEEINGVVNRLNAALSKENLESVSAILKNVQTTTASFADNRQRIEELLAAAQKTAAELGEASTAVKIFIKNNDGRLGEVSGEIAATLKQMNTSLQNLDKKSQEISGSVRAASQVFSQEATAVSQSISEAAATFSRTVEGFEDPQAILAGPREKALGPGEKIKK